jgi:hypothetical protein
MAKGNTFINDLLKLAFQATSIANIADNAASSPLTSLYLSLHTADPGAAGSQTTNETAYTNYARQAVSRSSSGFTVSGQSVTLTSAVSFPAGATTDTDVIAYWGVGTASSSTGKLLYSGPIGTYQGMATALASNDTLTIPGLTGVSNGDRFAVFAPPGGSLPAGLTSGTLYFVVNLSGTTLKLSTTSGGSAIDITADGQCICYKITPIAMGGGIAVTPQLTTGTTITEF